MKPDQFNLDLIYVERNMLAELEKWSNIEEKIWKQKSNDWIQLGDLNTKFLCLF